MLSPRNEGQGNKHILQPHSCRWSAHGLPCLWLCLPSPFIWFPGQPLPLRLKRRHLVNWAWLLPNFKLWVLLKTSDDLTLFSGSVRGHGGEVAPGDNAEKIAFQIWIQNWIEKSSHQQWDILEGKRNMLSNSVGVNKLYWQNYRKRNQACEGWGGMN